MQQFLVKYSWLIFFLLFFFAVAVGFYTKTSGKVNLEEVSVSDFNKYDFFTRVLTNNLLLTVTLIVGFFTFNIYNLVLVVQNGLLWGYNLSYYSSNGKSMEVLLLLLPHSIFEIFFIVWASHYSVLLSFSFFRLVDSSFADTSILTLLKSRNHFKIYLFVVFAALIETFISLQFYLQFK